MSAQAEQETVRGVYTSKVDLKTLQQSCKKLKIAADKGDRDAMIVALSEHFLRKHKDDPKSIIACDSCDGPSDLEIDCCPYCGKRDDEEPEPEKVKEATKPTPVAETGSSVKKVKGRGKPITAEDPPKETKLRVVKGSKIEKAGEVHQAEIVTSAKLDDAVTDIKTLEDGIASNHWKIGRVLDHVWTENLHLLRTDENGKRKYRSWGAWVEAEIGYSPRHGQDLIAVSRFFNEKTINEVGVTKLRPMCRIPEEAKRERLLERAKGEMLTRDQIEDEAKKLGDGKGRPNLAGRKPTAAELKTKQREQREEAAKNAKANGVTAIFQPGIFNVPAFSDEAKKKSKTPVRAHEVGDKPSGIFDMLNGVKMRISLVNEPEGLSFVVELTRED